MPRIKGKIRSAKGRQCFEGTEVQDIEITDAQILLQLGQLIEGLHMPPWYILRLEFEDGSSQSIKVEPHFLELPDIGLEDPHRRVWNLLKSVP